MESEILDMNDERVKMLEDLQLTKLELIEKIKTYYKFFDIKPNTKIKETSSLEDIEKELARCEIESEKNTDPVSQYKDLFVYGCYGLEKSTKLFNPFDLDIDGLGRVIHNNKNDPEFDIAIKKCILKYDLHKFQAMSPELSIAKFLINSVIVVNEFNKKNKPQPSSNMEANQKQSQQLPDHSN